MKNINVLAMTFLTRKIITKTVFPILIVLSGLFNTVSSQTTFQWAKAFGSLTDDIGYRVAIAATDSFVYTGGYFTGTMNLGNTSITSSGDFDSYLIKSTLDGEVVWAIRFGGPGYDRLLDMYCDDAGNLYITGWFANTATFGVHSLTSSGDDDVFIGKVKPNGTFAWIKKGGGSGQDRPLQVMLNKNQNFIAVSGHYRWSPAYFGNTYLPMSGGYDAFFAKLDTAGNYLWVKNISGSNMEIGYGIGIDLNDNIYASGYHSTSNLIIGGNLMTYYGGSDCFLVKYSSNGELIWAKTFGGSMDEIPYEILTTSDNKLVIGGYQYGSGTYLGIPLSSYNNSRDAFIIKSDTDGNGIWAKNRFSSEHDECVSVSITDENNIIFTGRYWGTIIAGRDTLISKGSSDGYIMNLDGTTGEPIWALSCGGTLSDACTGSDVFYDKVYVTGYFYGPAEFGNFTLNQIGGYDIFLAEISECSTIGDIGGSDQTIMAGQGISIGEEAINGYEYTWEPVAGLSDAHTAMPEASPEVTTTYYVTAVNAAGCTAGGSVTVTVTPPVYTTKLTYWDCGASNVEMDQTLTADPVPIADVYEFRMINRSIGFDRRIYKSDNSFTLTEFNDSIIPGVTFDVYVRIIDGTDTLKYGDNCRITTFKPDTIQYDSLPVYDRFNKEYMLSEIIRNPGNPNIITIDTSYFVIDFDNFNGQISNEAIETVIKAFVDISVLISPRYCGDYCQRVNYHIITEPNLISGSSEVSAIGSSFYKRKQRPCYDPIVKVGFMAENEVWKVIRTGYNDSIYYDAYIKIDSRVLNGNDSILYLNVSYEIMHTLGFASKTDQTGQHYFSPGATLYASYNIYDISEHLSHIKWRDIYNLDYYASPNISNDRMKDLIQLNIKPQQLNEQ